MRECWLRTNVRVLVFGSILTIFIGCVGVVVIVAGMHFGGGTVLQIAGWLLVAVGASATFVLLARTRTPRIGYDDEHLVFHVNLREPIRVPVEIVECFFLGQGSSMMKSRSGRELETATVVVRLAESAKEWHQRDFPRLLGQWCGGYITIRGTWCEPLTSDVFGELNARLVQAHRQRKQQSEVTTE